MPRQSAAVYRRRRLAVLLVLILLIALIAGGVWLAVAQPWSTAADPTPSASAPASDTPTAGATDAPATPSDSPSPDPSETPGIVACEVGDVEVTAVTDADTYAAGVLPKLSITLTSKSDHDCTLNVGSSTQKFTVTSGKDVWWRSTDCQTEPSDQIATLKAGSTVSTKNPVVWDRTRSSVDTCDQKNRARAPGGGASYHVSVSIGGFDSVASRQIILR
ncbi:hypothetical protein [Microbacterium suwonense]|uniref:Serine/threonine protein kinase n=1 Tax=Microbacterium suwonense TaxID=683047 RepID=A0ABM8FXL7_9MICO|nr:hypothetical protein [Microbacterium suwonense]BDZ40477.1 hypothetical protein GCM10025863_30910 [Microbacterium suwonense]